MNLIYEGAAYFIITNQLALAYKNNNLLAQEVEVNLPAGFKRNDKVFENEFLAAKPYAVAKTRVAILEQEDEEKTNALAAFTLLATKMNSVLILGPNNNRIYKKDETLLTDLYNQAKVFWEKHVLPQNPPLAILSVDLEPIVAERYALNLKIKDLEQKLKELDTIIKAKMAGAEIAQCGRFRITNKIYTKKVINKDLLPREVYESALVETQACRFEIKPLS